MQQKFLVESEEGLSELGLFHQKIDFFFPCEITIEGKVGPHSRYDIALKKKLKILRIRSLGPLEYEDMRCLSMMARAGTCIDSSGPIMKGRVIETSEPTIGSLNYSAGSTGFSGYNSQEPQKRYWDYNTRKKRRRNPFL